MIAMLKLPAALLLAATLAACHTYPGAKRVGGTFVGAGLGALAGSQIGSGAGRVAAIGAGALLGAVVGSEVGASLDRADRAHADRVAYQSLETAPSGATASWVNPDSGHAGSFTPLQGYRAQDGTYCREFQQTVIIGGEYADAHGTACRQSDGSWRIVSR